MVWRSPAIFCRIPNDIVAVLGVANGARLACHLDRPGLVPVCCQQDDPFRDMHFVAIKSSDLEIMTERMKDKAHWAQFADEWIAWARSPGHDAFWMRMHFAGWSQPLEDYVAALEAAGLAITSLREPVPDETSEDRLKQWARVPMFLWPVFNTSKT